jgi:RimJ/RimL family protein N-acetyltransferase
MSLLRLPEFNPAYRVLTERTLIRCWQPSDAVLLKEAIDMSIEHLRPWMPWVQNEPQDIAAKVRRIRLWRAQFDLNHNYMYGIFNLDESKVLGGTGLHTRIGPDALEIGYWIRVNHANRGLGTEVAAALSRVAFEVNKVNRVEIHCNPRNKRSAAIPKKLGYQHEATLRQRVPSTSGEYRDAMIWTLFKADYATSPAAQFKAEAFDALGVKIL